MPITWENLEEKINELRILSNKINSLSNTDPTSRNLSKISIAEINSYQNGILVERLKELKFFLFDKSKEIEEIKTEIEEASLINQKIEEAKTQNNILEVKQILSKFRWKYFEKINNNNKKIEKTKQEILINQKDVEELKKELKELQEESEKLGESNNSYLLKDFLSQQQEQYKEKIDRVKEKIKEKQKDTKKLQDENANLTKKNKQINSNLNILDKEIKNKKYNKPTLLKIFVEEIKYLKRKEKELKEQINFVFSNFEREMDEYKEKSKNELNELVQQYSNLLKQKQDNLKSSEDCEIQLKKLAEKAVTLETEKKQYENKLATLKQEQAKEKSNSNTLTKEKLKNDEKLATWRFSLRASFRGKKAKEKVKDYGTLLKVSKSKIEENKTKLKNLEAKYIESETALNKKATELLSFRKEIENEEKNI